MTLTKSDLNKISDIVDAKLDAKLTNYATKDDLAKLRQDMIGDKVEILAAINKKDEDDTAHKMLHENLGGDVPKLQQQVQHLFKTFEIEDPTQVVAPI